MALFEVVSAVFGWFGELVEWLVSLVPRYVIIRCNEVGVRYWLGGRPRELGPGLHWYWPWCTEVNRHHANRMTLDLDGLSLETSDAVPVQVGLIVTYHLVDVIKYEVENFEPDEGMAEVAQGALRDIVAEHTWRDLSAKTEEGSRLEQKLARRMGTALDRFGVRVESCRPTDQVRLRGAFRLFGVDHQLILGKGAE